MTGFIKYILGISLLLASCGLASAQPAGLPDRQVAAYRVDTLRLRIAYASGGTDVDLGFGDNAASWTAFEQAFRQEQADTSAALMGFRVRTGTSLEGTPALIARVSELRLDSIRELLDSRLGTGMPLLHVNRDKGSWEELETAVLALSKADFRWKDEVLAIVRSDQTEARMTRLRSLAGGEPWQWLMANVYPVLRSSEVTALFMVTRPANELTQEEGGLDGRIVIRDTEVRTRIVRDTVLLSDRTRDVKYARWVQDRKFIFALRTNILAVPLANVGAEFPIGEHFSVGVDWYYPWIWRNDLHRECNELLAGGLDFRWWPGRDGDPAQARLLGHSFGIYGAGGHYDFERNWHGYQGTFWNAGIDWMYAVPVFHGHIHLEFELGLGFIFSMAQPYNVFFPNGDCIREPGVSKGVRWIGPTRAQVSVVVPIYVRKDRRTR